MKTETTRQQAITLARSFAVTISLARGKPVNFYKLLWVAHWAVENFGLERTRQTLIDILIEYDFEVDDIAGILQDRLFMHKIEDDTLAEWFERAMKN